MECRHLNLRITTTTTVRGKKKQTVRPISGSPSVAGGHEEQVKRWEESRPSSSSRAVGFLEQVQRTWLPTRQHHSQSHVASGRLPQLQKLTVDITERMRCFSVIPTASAMIICRRLSSQKIKKASRYADHRLIPRVHQCKRAAEVRPRATRSLLQSHQHLITPKEKNNKKRTKNVSSGSRTRERYALTEQRNKANV